ncbi:Serine/threonine protein kinase PrkC, regulator of stationary phase [Enhygromyxa salina]|uniref:non-specific serine/threonine protein kinase n=1 Tax=Enhygromyxa salina TaxID=215803 RepID=A0A0C2D4B1_9BACT|nr:serine/threonine-protein kinase [Enhygromyxa salina]KIG14932.1 Serine/threonine protein kinase PrkC, regulator of stationary phase [Enhygromyxa salina]
MSSEPAQAEPQLSQEELENIELAAGSLITQSKTYKIVDRLGEGGFGKVYKVFDPIMNRYSALKMMKMSVPEDERRRFRQEARLCGTFMHPNLIRTLEVGTTKEHGLFWFAMDYLEGSDLLGYLNRGQHLSFAHLREIFSQTLDALTHVHARNFVHCDIKPANIFVAIDLYDPNLRLVKLIDFGVAMDLTNQDPAPKGTARTARIMGDPFYMPPEQTYANPKLDARSDLYALGITFYEMVTNGHHPFEDLFEQHPREALMAQRERIPAPPSTYLPADIDPEHASDIDGFFATATAKNPNERFPSAAIMKRALQHVVDPQGE